MDPRYVFLGIAVVHIFSTMAVEARLSRHNERYLRSRGAVEPPDDVWRSMRVVYPAAFVAMVVESAIRGGPPPLWFLAGMAIWIAAKLLKAWAISTLGDQWSFRVLVLPGMVLTTKGPYRWLRHPNYVAVAGELIGAAVGLAAPVSGVIFTLAFLEILRRRIQVEERALRIHGFKGLTES